MIVLRNINPTGAGKEGRYDSFFAGLLGGYAVFGRQPGSVSQQVRIAIPDIAREPHLLYVHDQDEIKVFSNHFADTAPDRHLRLRACNARARQNRHSAQHAPSLLSNHP